jgi:LysM repeat protein
LASDLEAQEEEITQIKTSLSKALVQINSLTTSVISIAMVLQMMTDADVIDADNIAVETFRNGDDLVIYSGTLDTENRRIYA